MTYQEKVEWLKRYRYLIVKVKYKEKQLVKWQEQAYKMSKPISDMPKSSNTNNPIEEFILAAVDMQREIARDLTRSIELITKIEKSINLAEDEACKQVLTLKYINLLTFEQIAVEMKYSYEQIKRIHKKAILSLKMTPNDLE